MEPFVTNAKLPTGTHAKPPKSHMSAAERLRRLGEAIAFLRHHLARSMSAGTDVPVKNRSPTAMLSSRRRTERSSSRDGMDIPRRC